MPPLLSRPLRTPLEVDLVAADALRDSERRAAGALLDAPDFYGVVRPRDLSSRLPTRAIDRATADLLLTLREPSPLPERARQLLGEEAEPTVRRWVADGVLEVEIDGVFLAGPEALERLGVSTVGTPASHLAARSLAALRSAASLPAVGEGRIAFHLYAAGRLPVTERWRRLLPNGEAVLRYLDGGEGAGRRPFDRDWYPSHRSSRWRHWRSLHDGSPRPSSGAPTFKLYLSPVPEDLPAAWGAAREILSDCGAFELKVGADAAGLLRPDKLVAYFADRARLEGAARRLEGALRGLAVQGVPFSADLGLEGLLSWGLDPPPLADEGGAPNPEESWRRAAGEGESWRGWICRELAKGLREARRAGEPAERGVRFALARIRLLGVDPDSWEPLPGEPARRDPPEGAAR